MSGNPRKSPYLECTMGRKEREGGKVGSAFTP